MWVCCDQTYLVGPSRGTQILLLQETRSIRLRWLCPTRRQEAGLYTNSYEENIMPWSIAGWGKNIWPMVPTYYEPINLSMGFDLFDLILTSGVYGTPGVGPKLCRAPLFEKVYSSLGMFLASWAGLTWVRDFFCFLLFGLSPSTLKWVIL